MHDSRMDHALKKGDQLYCKEGIYEIIGLIGSGGMSLVYEAVLAGETKPCALKEYYPYGQGMVRTNGIIVLTEQQQTMAMHEMEMSQLASCNTRRTAPSKRVEPFEIVVDGVRYQPGRQGVFMVQEHLGHGICFDAMVQHLIMDGQRFPHIFDTLSLVEQVLLALNQCHQNGVWFGDVHPGNVIFCGVDHQNVKYGDGVLIDFNASQKLEADGKTKPLNGICVAQDYAAPELYEPNVRIGPEADIYAVGMLLQRCIMNSEELEAGASSPVVLSSLYERRGRQLGCRDNWRTLYDLISKATAQDPKDRYANADDMLKALGKLMEKVTPPSHRLPNNLSAPEYFQPGNRLELIENARQELLKNNATPLIIHGLGGIGKTETAIQLGLSLMRQDNREVYLIHWQESTRRTVESLFPDPDAAKQDGLLGRHYARRNPDELFKRNLNILNQEYRGTVLILDNFYQDSKGFDELRREDAFQQLLGLCPEVSLVLTTRYDDTKSPWKIDRLSVDDLLELMQHFMPYQWETENEDDLRALICKVDQHTLTVTLIAKTLEAMEGDLTAAQLLEIFDTNTLAAAEMDMVSTEQNRTYEENRIYGHLKKLFDYSGLSEAQLQMMAIACILPEGGMDLDLLKSCLPKELNDARKTLMHRGWLERRGGKFAVHPLVAQICREILKPDAVEGFLLSLMQKCDTRQYIQGQLLQAAQTFANASEHIYPTFAMSAGALYMQLGDVVRSKVYSTKGVGAMARANANPEILAVCQCQLAEALRMSAEPEKAINNAQLALGFYEMSSNKAYPLEIHLCITRCNVDLGNYTQALADLNEAKKHLTSDTKDSLRAELYNVLGVVYNHLGNDDEALSCLQEAKRIFDKILDKSSVTHAVLSANIGACYRKVNPNEALKRCREAEEMFERLFHEEPHPEMMGLHMNMAIAHIHLNQFSEAEFRLKKQVELAQTLLGAGHQGICDTYRLLSAVCEKQGKQNEQRKYLKLAVESGSVESIADLIAQSNTPKEIAEAQEYLKRLRVKGIDTTMWEMALRFKSGGKI